MRIWIDVENPPQVQYLTPLADAFRQAGADVVLTARDYGSTYALLEGRGVPFHARRGELRQGESGARRRALSGARPR